MINFLVNSEYDEQNSVALIRETLSRGINYLETSPWYGQGSSERTVGKVISIHFYNAA